MPLSGRCRRAGSSDSDAREPLFRSEAVQAAARRPHQKVLGWATSRRRAAADRERRDGAGCRQAVPMPSHERPIADAS